MARGRPRGSGYDDRERITAVTRLMASGMSRRAAILSLFGPDQLRRLEMKMRVAAMAGTTNDKLEAIIRATMRGMGASEEQVSGARLVQVGYYTVAELATMVERAKELGHTLVYRRVPDPA